MNTSFFFILAEQLKMLQWNLTYVKLEINYWKFVVTQFKHQICKANELMHQWIRSSIFTKIGITSHIINKNVVITLQFPNLRKVIYLIGRLVFFLVESLNKYLMSVEWANTHANWCRGRMSNKTTTRFSQDIYLLEEAQLTVRAAVLKLGVASLFRVAKYLLRVPKFYTTGFCQVIFL